MPEVYWICASSCGLTGGSAVAGLYWLTANLAERGPLLLTVDDAHWADEASLRFLVYLLHRVEALPVLLVVAGRRAEPGADEALLEALRSDPLTRILQPAPLSEEASAAVVRAAFPPRADAEICRACRTVTGGNPLLLRMLSRALQEEGADPAAGGGGRVAELAPQVVASSVLPRLRRLPDVGAFARAVAVLGDGVEVRHAAAVAALGIGPATRAADALAAAGILVRGRPLEFAHPTVRRAVYESLPPADQHRAHRHAAELLDADGAPVDRIAAHLLATERLADSWVVEIMRVAARQALARGAGEEAMRYLEPARQEPPPPALARVRSSTARDTRGALAVLDRAVDELGEVDPDMRVRLEAEYISVARRYPGTRAKASRWLRVLAEHAEPSASPAACCWRTSPVTPSRRRARWTRPPGWPALPWSRTTCWSPGSPTSP